MDRELIIRLARRAGAVFPSDGSWHKFEDDGSLERFAALVIANNPPQSWMSYQEGYEAGQQAGKHEVKDLSNYEFKTYKTGGADLEAGFYSPDELRDLVKALDKMNAATERSMRRMK